MSRQRIDSEKGLVGHVQKRNNLCCTMITCDGFPTRAAFDVIEQTLNEFDNYSKENDDASNYSNQLKSMIDRAQDIAKKNTKLRQHETRDVLCQSLERLYERGERLDDLIEQTNSINSHTPCPRS
jgi:Iap family predicted aminopeptidase